jgi:myosin heavy subunit
MGFDYDKIKNSDEGSYWASYSDLFMVLSMVFLFLYIIASLKSGTQGIMQNAEFKQLARERDDLKQQIQMYNTLKEDYLETGASASEQKSYEELMEKLVLLKEEAKDEKDKLRQAAQENEAKEEALNEYQQMVRNIINNNMISQAEIKQRDKTIVKKNVVIKDNKREIANLKVNIDKKEQEIEQSEKEIKNMNKKLEIKIAQLKTSYMTNRITKQKMEENIEKLKQENVMQVSELEAVNQRTKQEIQKISQVLNQSQQQLNQAQQRLQSQSQKLSQLVAEKNQLRQKTEQMNQEFEDQLKKEKAQFDSEIRKQQLSAQAKAKKLAQFRKEAQAKQAQLAKDVAAMEAQAEKVQNDLDKTLLAKNELAKKAENLEGSNKNLSRDVARLKEMADARNKVIRKIASNLKNAGIEAQVDGKSGDVVISFGEEYFDSGKASLKPGMEQVLKKFMPAYSSSLLSDPETAEKIQSIEIVGFASPTYKGKYVDPKSLKAGNKEAMNYNLDLSYYRARSIFDYVFDTNKMKYQHQKDILPIVKVTGRSFLADGENPQDAANMSQKEYCSKYDCKKSQRVMIKFNMQP